MDNTQIVIIVLIVLFYTFLIGGSAKRNSTTSIIVALFGLLLLPIAHIVASFLVVSIANDAIKSCLTYHNNIIGTALSNNLGVFSFIGEFFEEQLRESYTSDIQEHLAKAIEFRKWSQILMYTSLTLVFFDLFCLYLRNQISKKSIKIARAIFTITIGYFVYSGMILVFRISSTVLDAKSYGLFSFFTGGETFGYDVSAALAGVAMFVIPLGILHFFHFRCANRYFVNEKNNNYVKVESAPILTIPDSQTIHYPRQHSQQLYQEFPHPFMVESDEDCKIEKLSELMHAGILTEEEYITEKSKIVPSSHNENTKISMLQKLKKLYDAGILTPKEYKKEKMGIFFSEEIPKWIPPGKTKVEVLVEYKKMLDDGTLDQEEFDYIKRDILIRY